MRGVPGTVPLVDGLVFFSQDDCPFSLVDGLASLTSSALRDHGLPAERYTCCLNLALRLQGVDGLEGVVESLGVGDPLVGVTEAIGAIGMDSSVHLPASTQASA